MTTFAIPTFFMRSKAGFRLLCLGFALFFAPNAALAQSSCQGMETISRLLRFAAPMVADPASQFNSITAKRLDALVRGKNTKTLERLLNERWRSLEITQINGTFAKLREAAQISVDYGSNAVVHYVTDQKLQTRVADATRTMHELCGTEPDPEAGDPAKPKSMSALITQAVARKTDGDATIQGGVRLTSIYSILAVFTLLALGTPYTVAWVRSMMLKQHPCRIDAVVHGKDGDYTGQVVMLSVRGFTFRIAAKHTRKFAENIEKGASCLVRVGRESIQVRLKNAVRMDTHEASFVMKTEIPEARLVTILAQPPAQT